MLGKAMNSNANDWPQHPPKDSIIIGHLQRTDTTLSLGMSLRTPQSVVSSVTKHGERTTTKEPLHAVQ
jgi:hypothetical protein